jgi:flavin-dependent dehydrogenase
VTRGGTDCDVLIIGGGPAGAAAAQLLASWDRSVIIVERSTRPRHSLVESLPASTRKLLHVLGQLERVDAARLYPNTGNVALWGGASRITTTADAGFHVSRARFDAILRDGAGSAGARTIEARVLGIDDGDPVRVTCATGDGGRTRTVHRAHYVLDCSGRAGVIARRGLRRSASVHTMAIVAEWNCEAWPEVERTQTTVESYRDGWAWSVPLSPTRRQCTVMVDSERSGERPALAAKYRSELAKTTALARRLRDSRQISAPWTCDASTYDSTRAAEGRVLLVGDAASAIDPISSAGVKKALLSAWRAAIVVNTCLADSSMATPAFDLHVRRERQIFLDYARRSAAFFGEAAAVYDAPFWCARASACDAAGDTSVELDGDDNLARDPELHAAFAQLRRSAAVRLRTAGTLRFETAPVIVGRRVVMREAIVVPGRETPMQFAAGVDLPALARLAADGRQVPELLAAYRTEVGPAPLDGLLTGLSWLVARHALVAEDSTV